MSRRCTWVGCLAVIAMVVLSRTAGATQTVVLVMAGGSQQELAPVEQQLRSELLASGFGVTAVQVPELSDSESFERTASDLVTQAAIAVIRSESAVSGFVWATSKNVERTLVRPIQPVALSDEAPTVFAIRATELLHAVLLELGWPKRTPPDKQGAPMDANDAAAPESADAAADPAPPPPPSTPTPISVPPPPPPPTPVQSAESAASPAATQAPVWAIRSGAAVIGGPGGIPVGLAPVVGMTRRLGYGFSLQALLTGPVLGRVEAEAGAARVNQEFGVLRLGWQTRLAPWLEGSLLGGGGAYRLGVAGRALPPNESRRDAVWSAIAVFGGGARVPLGRSFAMLAEADAGLTAPRGKVVFLGQPVAQVPRPLLMGVLAVEYAW